MEEHNLFALVFRFVTEMQSVLRLFDKDDDFDDWRDSVVGSASYLPLNFDEYRSAMSFYMCLVQLIDELDWRLMKMKFMAEHDANEKDNELVTSETFDYKSRVKAVSKQR